MKDEKDKTEESEAVKVNSGSSVIRHPSSFLLGVFILFQLVYLPAANIIKLFALRLPESKGELDDDIQLHGQQFPEPLQTVADATGTAFVRWGELTGQTQGWSLFAPIFGHQASLPMVILPNATLRSEFSPMDPDSYLRLPSSSCRLFNYEYRLALVLWAWERSSYEENRDRWHQAIQKRVARQHRSIQTYLAWRTHGFALGNSPVYLYAELVPNPPLHDPSFERAAALPFPLAIWEPGGHSSYNLQALANWEIPSGKKTWLPIEDEP
jgi:hypothetical protein